jgi:hypothetical protein
MKTNLNRHIESEDQAKEFLSELFQNGEGYHPEDDAFDISWDERIENPTEGEMRKLNRLMDEVHEHIPDPCGYIVDKGLIDVPWDS